MTKSIDRKFKKEINAGTISLVVLAVLHRSDEPLYGYEIARRLQAHSDTELPMNQAAIYPVLRSLERQELLSSEIRPSDSGPPRKYYRLLPAGQAAFREWARAWERSKSFVDSFLENPDAAASPPAGNKVPGRTGTGR